jgi:(R,R)-butanediol dehydrogenase / meso-butanediol dehydrogenase / diacetyl reductase
VPALFPPGTVPGHELSGTVVAIGDGLPSWRLGERVSVLPFAQCGECELCLAGHEQVCPHAIRNGVGLGTGRPGGYAELLVVDGRMLFAQPAIVLGAGTVGLLTALVLAGRGHEQLVVVSRNAARRELAASLGLRAVSLEDAQAAARIAPECVFECAGTPAAARLAVELVGALGRIMLVGLAVEPLDLEAPPILFKEIELRGILSYSRADFAAAIELLARGAIPVDSLVTAVAPLEDAEACFQALCAPGNRHLKILLSPARRPPASADVRSATDERSPAGVS